MTRRIVSFLPSATEMAFALGLGDQVYGVSHECDYPPEARTKPAVVRNALPIEQMSQAQIDVAVTERLRSGFSLYVIDDAVVLDAAPDLVITQNLCEVCAPAGNEIADLLRLLPNAPEVLWMSPKSLEQIFDNVRDLGQATAREHEAARLISQGRARLERVRVLADTAASRPRVFCMEWMDPVYCCGHWVPEMVALAGGEDALGRLGADSVRIPWDSVLAWAPEVLVVMPCGFGIAKAFEEAQRLLDYPGWSQIPAVLSGQVYVADANAYFARPGPRVVDGTELLAHLIHPELFAWTGEPDASRRLEMPEASRALLRAG
jgi:iron complex transport system substrate-binding protein